MQGCFFLNFIALTGMLDLIENKYVAFPELYVIPSSPYKVLKDIKMNDMAVCTVVDTVGHSRQD